MSIWQLARSRQWLGWLGLTVLVALVCCALGTWQFARRAEAQAEIAKVEANYDREPVPFAEELAAVDSWDEQQEWTPVVVEGEYLVDDEMLVRNRPRAGRVGYEVLTPLRLADGTIFIVNRGWIPSAGLNRASEVPAAPTGEVEVVARLKPTEPQIAGRTDPEGTNQVATIRLEGIDERLGGGVHTSAYGQLVSEDPEPAEQAQLAARPVLDEGPHLSYALQWFVFATLAFIGYGYLLRQEWRRVNADDPEERMRADERRRRASLRKPSDAEDEDALLDAAGR
ncbi:MAG: SURF1 family protein [Microbacteriaceae bacterium]